MPSCTPRQQTDELYIHIDPDHCLNPGDTITGTVSRRVFTSSPRATLRISLLGRLKIRETPPPGGASSGPAYSGQFDLIDPGSHKQIIFDDKLVLYNPEGESRILSREDAKHWPFSFELPTHCCARPLARYGGEIELPRQYLPFDPESSAATPLPPDFHINHDVGFIEYCLKATLQWTSADESSSGKEAETWSRAEAFCQLHVVPRHPRRITDFDHRRLGSTHSLCSWALVPGAVESGLSFSQQRRALFGSKKVPRLKGQLQVDLPRVLQLGRKDHVPLHVRFLPLPDGTNISREDVGTVKIELTFLSVLVCFGTQIAVRTQIPPSFGWESESDSVGGRLWPPPGTPDIKDLKDSERIYIPCSTGRMLDVGGLVGFNNSAVLDGLVADFTTFVMKHEHEIYVTLKAQVAGEEISLEGSNKLRVIPPPPKEKTQETAPAPAEAGVSGPVEDTSWIQPPPEEDPPPTFEEVQRQDRKAEYLRDMER